MGWYTLQMTTWVCIDDTLSFKIDGAVQERVVFTLKEATFMVSIEMAPS